MDWVTLLRRQVFCRKIAIKNHFSHDCAPWAFFSHGEHHKSSKQRVLFCHCCFMVITQLYLFIVSGSIGFHIIMAPTNTFYYFWVVYILIVVILHHWLSLTGSPFLVEPIFTRRWHFMGHFRLLALHAGLLWNGRSAAWFLSAEYTPRYVWEEESELRNCIHQTGLSASLWGIFFKLMVEVGGPSSLLMVLALDR